MRHRTRIDQGGRSARYRTQVKFASQQASAAIVVGRVPLMASRAAFNAIVLSKQKTVKGEDPSLKSPPSRVPSSAAPSTSQSSMGGLRAKGWALCLAQL